MPKITELTKYGSLQSPMKAVTSQEKKVNRSTLVNISYGMNGHDIKNNDIPTFVLVLLFVLACLLCAVVILIYVNETAQFVNPVTVNLNKTLM